MKKYLTVGYAYPVYFLLILGQYFLAEGLDSLYDVPDRVPAVAQPAESQLVAPDTDKGAHTAFTGLGQVSGKGQ